MDYTENIKLIAEFTEGITYIVDEEDFLTWNYPDGLKYAKTNSHPKDLHVLQSEGFKYHKSWDLLMPVVEKIESYGYSFNILTGGSFVRERLALDYIATYQDESKLINTYKTVVEFIKWYNKQKA